MPKEGRRAKARGQNERMKPVGKGRETKERFGVESEKRTRCLI